MGGRVRVLVSGDRNWSDRARLFRELDARRADIDLIIEGCADGADMMAGDHSAEGARDAGWARLRGVPALHFPVTKADWKLKGRSAGPQRNRQMLVEGKPDLVIAFHNDIAKSRGTADMLRQARKAGVPALLCTSTDGWPDEPWRSLDLALAASAVTR